MILFYILLGTLKTEVLMMWCKDWWGLKETNVSELWTSKQLHITYGFTG